MQATETRHALGTGAEHQVVGVAQNDVCARVADLIEVQGFDRADRANRHERRCVDDAARGCDLAQPRAAVLADQLVAEGRGLGVLH